MDQEDDHYGDGKHKEHPPLKKARLAMACISSSKPDILLDEFPFSLSLKGLLALYEARNLTGLP